jgi:hypothetical protein
MLSYILSADFNLIGLDLLAIKSIFCFLPLRRQNDHAMKVLRDAVRANYCILHQPMNFPVSKGRKITEFRFAYLRSTQPLGQKKQKSYLTYPNFGFIIEIVRCQ